jgi:putative tryptophan/tyrosine transport system substrate-binding protein
MNRRAALSALLALSAVRGFAQSGRSNVVGVLIAFPENDPEIRPRVAAFVNGLQKLGWRDGQNLRLEVRHAVGAAALERQAAELAALGPAVMLVQTNLALGAVRKQNVAVPLVFVAVSDPVGSGFVDSLARPGGNATGFANFAPEMGAKWVELLRELSPRLDRLILLLNPAIPANQALARSAESAAAAAGMAVTAVTSGDSPAFEAAVAGFADRRRAGIIVMPNPANTQNQNLIIEAAARHRTPAIYPFAYYARNGGLVAYSIDLEEQFRLAAAYVDRILRGAKAGELPVQQPTKYELVINQRSARALGLTVPAALRARVDEWIE